ncbi:2-methylisocitrate lyase [Legionella beliardensis]|uniref:2-methylisocitrate lyase n=1 Tax=Legionella beliardensis TaxID=91822 RepID=A0A378I1P5_9GAMM|nr:methylisocitrate lyase [Legionella beliardensis]STX29107.1 2-methylisocitrate lyase [Legionella beliardensis]
MISSKGRIFRELVANQLPLQVVGVINAYCAMLAEQAGCQAIYLSGAGVANASYGIPDLGMTNLTDVLEDVRRINQVTSLPLLVDVDTGWGHAFNVARTIKLMESAGVAAIHIEDQILAKRCGHRPNKEVVSKHEMGDRIKAAVDARLDDEFVIMARTDAYAIEGLAATIERAQYYVELGADMIFAEAITSLADYQRFTQSVKVPVLANITEFGKTPLFTRQELADVGIQLILYPLSAFRAMSKAASDVYKTILGAGTQKEMLPAMQTRNELYEVLGYHSYEKRLDQLMEEQDG